MDPPVNGSRRGQDGHGIGRLSAAQIQLALVFAGQKMLSLHEIRVPHPRRAIKGYERSVTNVEEKEEEGGGIRGEYACIVMPFFLPPFFFFSLSV